MSWNYRVMRKGGYLAIYAAYYDDAGHIHGWSESPFSPEADSIEQLRATLDLMAEALKKEIVEIQSTPESNS